MKANQISKSARRNLAGLSALFLRGILPIFHDAIKISSKKQGGKQVPPSRIFPLTSALLPNGSKQTLKQVRKA
jgi:hypothetical protein